MLCAYTQNGSDCQRRDRIGWNEKIQVRWKYRNIPAQTNAEGRRRFVIFFLFIRSGKRELGRQRRCRLSPETVSLTYAPPAHERSSFVAGSGHVIDLAIELVIIFQNVLRSKRNRRRQDSGKKHIWRRKNWDNMNDKQRCAAARAEETRPLLNSTNLDVFSKQFSKSKNLLGNGEETIRLRCVNQWHQSIKNIYGTNNIRYNTPLTLSVSCKFKIFWMEPRPKF